MAIAEPQPNAQDTRDQNRKVVDGKSGTPYETEEQKENRQEFEKNYGGKSEK